MRFAIILALIVAVASAAPLHDEPELDGSEPAVKVFKEDPKKNVVTAKKEVSTSETKSSERHSEEKEVEDDDEEEDFDNYEYDQESGGVEMIALFAMKLQPAHQTSLFEYPVGLPLGYFLGPYNHLMHGHEDRGGSTALRHKKL